MKITVTWDSTDIKAGVKVADKAYPSIAGIIVVLRSTESNDNVIHPSLYGVVGAAFDMKTEFMPATQLADLLSKRGCTL